VLLLLLLSQATIYVYQLVDGEVKVEKIDHTKAPPAAAVTA
jgi:vacuolar protein sorting-associated protein 29